MEITHEEYQKYKLQCQQAINDIIWPEDALDLPNLNIADALKLAKNGQKLDKETVKSLEPNTLLFHEWMDYVHIVTICYNECHLQQKFTILRTGY